MNLTARMKAAYYINVLHVEMKNEKRFPKEIMYLYARMQKKLHVQSMDTQEIGIVPYVMN